MPSPAPLTRKPPFAYGGLPAIPSTPMSWPSHETGNGWAVISKSTTLLLFMLGATETNRYPDVAEAEIVITMDVSLHESMVIGEPLSVTALAPCVAPNPDPVITTWLPIAAVVAETLVMLGPGDAVQHTE